MRNVVGSLCLIGFLSGMIAAPALADPQPTQFFARRMKVLTPDGYVELGKLAPGDAVLSWDEAAKRLIPNRVRKVQIVEDQVYGDLTPADLNTTIEVTADQPFLVPKLGSFIPVTDIDPHDKLRVVRVMERGRCGALLTERGDFRVGGIGPVMTLDLENQPDNFVVEGIVARKQ